MVRWQEVPLANKKSIPSIPKVLLCNCGGRRPEEELADSGLPGKMAIKWK